ncbi:hypothetical protein ACFL3V_02140 [Nanoarchaeota archaeon]
MTNPDKHLKKGKKHIETVKAGMEHAGVASEEEIEIEFLDESEAVAQSMQDKIGKIIDILENAKGVIGRVLKGDIALNKVDQDLKALYEEVCEILGANPHNFSCDHPAVKLVLDSDDVWRMKGEEQKTSLGALKDYTEGFISQLRAYHGVGLKAIAETEKTKQLLQNLRFLENKERSRFAKKAERAVDKLEKHAKKSGIKQALVLEAESLALLKKNQEYVLARVDHIINAIKAAVRLSNDLVDVFTSSPDFHKNNATKLQQDLAKISKILGRKDFIEVTDKITADLLKVVDNAELREKSAKALQQYLAKVIDDLEQVRQVGPEAVKRLDFAETAYQKILKSLESR